MRRKSKDMHETGRSHDVLFGRRIYVNHDLSSRNCAQDLEYRSKSESPAIRIDGPLDWILIYKVWQLLVPL